MRSGCRESRLFTHGSTRRTKAGIGSNSTGSAFLTITFRTRTIGRTPNLREKYDVIIFGPIRTSAQNDRSRRAEIQR